jgi:hypothetical protein
MHVHASMHPADSESSVTEQEPAGPPATERRTVATTTAAGLPIGRIILGLLLVFVGLAWALDTADVLTLRWPVILAVALVVVGIGLVVDARRGMNGGLLATGIVLTALLLVSSLAPVRVAGPVGERVAAPTSIEAVDDRYEMAMGSLTVDLRQVDMPAGDTEIEVQLGMGELVVRLPEGVAVEIRGRVGAGEIQALGRSAAGVGVSLDEVFPDADAEATLILELQVGLGKIEVRR